MEFHVADFQAMVVIGAGQASCAWNNMRVAVNYKAVGVTTGDIVSIELPNN